MGPYHPSFAGGSINLKNTVITGNDGSDCFGTVTAQGYNIIQGGMRRVQRTRPL